MSSEQLVIGLAVLVMLVATVLGIGLYNEVKRLLLVIPEISSNIVVLQKKRTDLIGRLVSIVESYGLHESTINTRISGDVNGTSQQGAQSMVARLASLRMAFPELKADSLYEMLMQELVQVETDLAKRREQYNATVRSYNVVISQFPGNFVLLPFGFQNKAYLSEQELSA